MHGMMLRLIVRPSENSKDLVIEDISPLDKNHKTILDIHSYSSSRFNLPALADISERIYIKLIYRDFIQEVSRSNSNFKYLDFKSQSLEVLSKIHLITNFSNQPKLVIDLDDLVGMPLCHICSPLFLHLIENDTGEIYVQGKALIRSPNTFSSIIFSNIQ